MVGPFHEGSGGPGGWYIVYEPELHFRTDVLVPGLGWVAPYPDASPAGDPLRDTGAGLVVRDPLALDDVVRSREEAGDLRARGVPWAWLIDPLARTLEVLKLENGRWTILATHAGDEVVRAEPFEAIELELAALWGETG